MTSPSSPMRSSGHFQVMLLGPFVVTRDGTSLTSGTWPRRTGSLFRLLAISPDKRCSRDEVIEALWPSSSSHAGHSNLRCTLHHLRRILGNAESPVILADRLAIALNPAYRWEIDLERLEEVAHQEYGEIAELESAAALYRGDPLYEDRYDDWTTATRERVHADWRSVCLRLARAYSARHAIERAVWWFERVLESDPLDEEAVRGLMGSLNRLGQRTKAIRIFERFECELRQEMDIEPDGQTCALFEKLKSSGAGASASGPTTGTLSADRELPVTYRLSTAVPLIGRRKHLRRIQDPRAHPDDFHGATIASHLRQPAYQKRKTLTRAGILGQKFDSASLEAMEGANREAMLQLSDDALDAYLLIETEQGFAFRHAVVHEVVYGAMVSAEMRQTKEALLVLEEALALNTDAGDLRGVGIALTYLGTLSLAEGKFEQGRTYREQAVAAFERWGEPEALAWGISCLADVHYLLGNWTEAREKYARANDLVESLPATSRHSSLPSVGLGVLFMSEGRLEEAARYLDQGMMLAERTAHIWALEQARVALAEMDLLAGNAARSLARLRPRLDHPNPDIATNPPTVLARARLAMGDVDGAGEVVQQGLERAIRGGSQSDQLEWLCVQGSVLTDQQRWDEAGSMFEEAVHMAHGMPYPRAEACALQEYACMYARKGATDKARLRLDEALRIFRRLGAHPNIERVEALSEQLAPRGLSSVR